jgi:hypothetical protein
MRTPPKRAVLVHNPTIGTQSSRHGGLNRRLGLLLGTLHVVSRNNTAQTTAHCQNGRLQRVNHDELSKPGVDWRICLPRAPKSCRSAYIEFFETSNLLGALVVSAACGLWASRGANAITRSYSSQHQIDIPVPSPSCTVRFVSTRYSASRCMFEACCHPLRFTLL